jgi:putative Holliday junction resolvase
MSTAIVAFDYGTRRIGVASGNTLTATASPLTTLRVRGTIPWTAIDRIVSEWAPRQLVVGKPGASGATHIDAEVDRFVHSLQNRYKLPVAVVDETLTSAAASAELADSRRLGFRRKRIRKGHVDARAACLIAEQWLSEERKHGRTDLS